MAGRGLGIPRRPWEEEMLAEYLARHHPTCLTMNRKRLGPTVALVDDPTLTEAEIRAMGSASRRWADAVCISEGRMLVIEAAMLPDPRDISLLETYLHLVDATPELAEWARLPRAGLLVWGVDDPYSHAVAVKHGLLVEIFRPANWGEWLGAKRAQEGRLTRPVTTIRTSRPSTVP